MKDADCIRHASEVKQWYDGFIFGGHRDIYNPWSITNYLKEKKLRPYWADTSSNGLAGKLIRTASPEIKENMDKLLNKVILDCHNICDLPGVYHI